MTVNSYDIESTDTRFWRAKMTAAAVELDSKLATHFSNREEAASFLMSLSKEDAIIGHNIKFDVKGTCLVPSGQDSLPLTTNRFDPAYQGPKLPEAHLLCTLTISHLLDENGDHGLKDLAPIWLRRTLDDPIWVDRSGKDTTVYFDGPNGRLPVSDPEIALMVRHYCEEDVRAAGDLYWTLFSQLTDKQQQWYWDWEEDYVRALAEMEAKGVCIDTEKLEKLTEELKADLPELEKAVYAAVGYEFNIGSHQQLAKVLYSETWEDKTQWLVDGPPPEGDVEVTKVGRKWVYGNVVRKGMGLPEQYSFTKKKDGSKVKTVTTDKTAMAKLEELGHGFVSTLMDFRESYKLLHTYLLSFPKYMEGNRLYGHFNGTGTVTGRASSNHPNLQNIPARGKYADLVRSIFIPGPGMVFVIGDLDQIEYRLAAWFSQEPVMLNAFKEGRDVHAATAAAVLGREPKDKKERTVFGKNINFGELFGFGLAKFIAMAAAGGFNLTNAKGKAIMADFKARLPQIQVWKQDVVQFARVMGFVELPSGRRRNLPNINHPEPGKRFYAERQAVNSMCQGCAADLLKMITVLMYRKGWVGSLTVHDELVFECLPNEAERLTEDLHNSVDEAADTLGITRRLPGRVDCPVTMNVVTAKDWSEKA